jgi:hypothetical protein
MVTGAPSGGLSAAGSVQTAFVFSGFQIPTQRAVSEEGA